MDQGAAPARLTVPKREIDALTAELDGGAS
jgi:hypothetical protein